MTAAPHDAETFGAIRANRKPAERTAPDDYRMRPCFVLRNTHRGHGSADASPSASPPGHPPSSAARIAGGRFRCVARGSQTTSESSAFRIRAQPCAGACRGPAMGGVQQGGFTRQVVGVVRGDRESATLRRATGRRGRRAHRHRERLGPRPRALRIAGLSALAGWDESLVAHHRQLAAGSRERQPNRPPSPTPAQAHAHRAQIASRLAAPGGRIGGRGHPGHVGSKAR